MKTQSFGESLFRTLVFAIFIYLIISGPMYTPGGEIITAIRDIVVSFLHP